MQAMRDKLLDAQAAQQAAQTAELAAQIDEAARLASALTKLQSTEEQLRTLQATLIAERVARSQCERDASLYEHNIRDVKEELASAVRALRRARNEGRKSEEERRAMLRAYEMAQAKWVLAFYVVMPTYSRANQYQLELSVREAVSRGREKGRQEVILQPCADRLTLTPRLGTRQQSGWASIHRYRLSLYVRFRMPYLEGHPWSTANS